MPTCHSLCEGPAGPDGEECGYSCWITAPHRVHYCYDCLCRRDRPSSDSRPSVRARSERLYELTKQVADQLPAHLPAGSRVAVVRETVPGGRSEWMIKIRFDPTELSMTHGREVHEQVERAVRVGHVFGPNRNCAHFIAIAGPCRCEPLCDCRQVGAPCERAPYPSHRPETSALYCEHANENPAVCRCPVNCYCKSRTCKDLVFIPALGGTVVGTDARLREKLRDELEKAPEPPPAPPEPPERELDLAGGVLCPACGVVSYPERPWCWCLQVGGA